MALDTAAAVAKLRSLTATFDNGVRAAQPFYPTLCTTMTSDGADEEYGGLGNAPGMREWLGDRVFNSLRAGKFTIDNKTWESSLGIEKERIDDDRMGIYGPLMEQLAAEASYHPDELLIDLIEAGESTACFDGQYFYDNDHVWGDSGTNDNLLTYDASDHAAVTAAECKAAVEAAVEAMLGFKRDNGKLYHRTAVTKLTKLVVVFPLALRTAMHTAFESILFGGGNTNVVLDKPTLVCLPGLASDVKFWVNKVSDPIKPYIFQARRPLRRQMKGMDDNEFKDVKFMCDARYNMGYFAWWNSVQTEFN